MTDAKEGPVKGVILQRQKRGVEGRKLEGGLSRERKLSANVELKKGREVK